MNTYEITIYNMEDDTEMMNVQDALTAAGIGDAGDEEIGAYLQDGKSRSVFVEMSDLVKAVAVLNELGYETDENGLEDEE